MASFSQPAHGTAQGLSDLFSICFQDDNVQDFDTRWDQISMGTSEMPLENVLEGLYKNRLQGSEQLQHVICDVQPRIESRSRGAKLSKIEEDGETTY